MTSGTSELPRSSRFGKPAGLPRLLLAGAVGLMLLLPSRAGALEKLDWGVVRVGLQERWPAAEGGHDGAKGPPAGVALSRRAAGRDEVILDYRLGWVGSGDEGPGAVGMFKPLEPEQRLEVAEFGRVGTEIRLGVIVHPAGGVLPETVKDVVRRKRGFPKGSRDPVTMADARAAGIDEKRALFAAPFPTDLPAGEYRVIVELRDPAGAVKERYERRLRVSGERETPLENLSDGELLQEYVRRGEALKGSGAEPIDFPVGYSAAGFAYTSPLSLTWRATCAEIIRRGGGIVPEVMTLLESEAVRNPGEFEHMTAPFGFAVDLMRLLAEIGDPRPAELLVRIAAGMDGRANLPVREFAVNTLERLTYVQFDIHRDNPATPFAMMGEGALATTRADRGEHVNAGVTAVAGLYAKWLGGEGRDPARWLPLARARARKALEGRDPVAVRSAIAFLRAGTSGMGHDDAPEETMRAIAAIMERADQPALKDMKPYVSLTSELARYGPAARQYAERLIEQARQRPTSSSFADVAQVGGERAVAHLVQSLPALRAELERLQLPSDVDDDAMGDMEARQAVLAYRACRWGIERWAGRTLASDEQIHAWWDAAKGKTQRQWLEENLDRTAAEADGGSAKAQHLIRGMLPDLPHAGDDLPFHPPLRHRWAGRPYTEIGPGAFRQRWLNEHRGRLAYDERRSCFTVAPVR